MPLDFYRVAQCETEYRKFACNKLRYYPFWRANTKGADQTSMMRRLACAFIVHMKRNGVSRDETKVHVQ